MKLTVTEFKAECKSEPFGSYLLYGEEAFLRLRYLQVLRDAVLRDPALAAFNHVRIAGERFSPEELRSALEAPPVFAEQRLVEVHGPVWEDLSEEELQTVLTLCREGTEDRTTVVVFVCDPAELDPGIPKRPSKLLTMLTKELKAVEFAKETPARLEKWILRHLSQEKICADDRTVRYLMDYCGRDMQNLSTEIEKLVAYVKNNGREALEAEDIRRVCSGNSEYDAFAFANAILDGNLKAAFSVFAEQKARQERPELLFGGIARIWCDLYRLRVLTDSGASVADISEILGMKDYKLQLYQRQCVRSTLAELERGVALCAETDQKLKSGSSEAYLLLERLMTELCTKRGVAG